MKRGCLDVGKGYWKRILVNEAWAWWGYVAVQCTVRHTHTHTLVQCTVYSPYTQAKHFGVGVAVSRASTIASIEMVKFWSLVHLPCPSQLGRPPFLALHLPQLPPQNLSRGTPRHGVDEDHPSSQLLVAGDPRLHVLFEVLLGDASPCASCQDDVCARQLVSVPVPGDSHHGGIRDGGMRNEDAFELGRCDLQAVVLDEFLVPLRLEQGQAAGDSGVKTS